MLSVDAQIWLTCCCQLLHALLFLLLIFTFKGLSCNRTWSLDNRIQGIRCFCLQMGEAGLPRDTSCLPSLTIWRPFATHLLSTAQGSEPATEEKV